MKSYVDIVQIITALDLIARDEDNVLGLYHEEMTIDSGKFRTVYKVVVNHMNKKFFDDEESHHLGLD
jgi:hypothetical protein